MERLKKEKMRSKGSYTKNRNKLMMAMEGGLSSRMQVMESLNVFTDAYEDVLQACEKLETYYETEKDSGNLSATSNELEVIEEDFTEVEGIVKGYLSGVNKSSAKDQTERLKEEVSRRREEISLIEKEIEQTYAECERQLKQNLRSKKPPTEPNQAAGTTPHSELRDRERESERKSEEFKEIPLATEPLSEQNSGVQKQPVVSSPSHIPSASTTIGKVAGLSPPSFTGAVYSSTPFAPFYPPNSVPPVTSLVEQRLQFQQPTSVIPVVSIESLINQSNALSFSTVTTPSLSSRTNTNTTNTLLWRQSSLHAYWEQPTIFTVHFRPNQC